MSSVVLGWRFSSRLLWVSGETNVTQFTGLGLGKYKLVSLPRALLEKPQFTLSEYETQLERGNTLSTLVDKNHWFQHREAVFTYPTPDDSEDWSVSTLPSFQRRTLTPITAIHSCAGVCSLPSSFTLVILCLLWAGSHPPHLLFSQARQVQDVINTPNKETFSLS